MKKLIARIGIIGLFALAGLLGMMDTPTSVNTAYADGTPTPTPTPEQPDCYSYGCID